MFLFPSIHFQCLYRPHSQSIYLSIHSPMFLFSSIHFQCLYRPDAQSIYLSTDQTLNLSDYLPCKLQRTRSRKDGRTEGTSLCTFRIQSENHEKRFCEAFSGRKTLHRRRDRQTAVTRRDLAEGDEKCAKCTLLGLRGSDLHKRAPLRP